MYVFTNVSTDVVDTYMSFLLDLWDLKENNHLLNDIDNRLEDVHMDYFSQLGLTTDNHFTNGSLPTV